MFEPRFKKDATGPSPTGFHAHPGRPTGLDCAGRMPQRILDRFIDLNGVRLHYREAAGPPERSVVLLHSSSLHTRMWDATARLLADDGYRAIALDQRGYGESDRAPSYSLEPFVDDLAASIEALRIEPFALVGVSMGGRVAYTYAARPMARLRKLVIVDTGPAYERSGPGRVLANRAAPGVFRDIVYNLVTTPEGGWTWRYDPNVHAADNPRSGSRRLERARTRALPHSHRQR